MTCPICEATKRIRIYEGESWKVYQCKECTYAWWKDETNPKVRVFNWGEDVVLEGMKRTKMYLDRINRIDRYSPYPRIWLDIGCAGGGLLRCAKSAGWIVEGIEPGPPATYLYQRFGINVHRGILSTSELNHKEYGVISYFHVLEHVPDPVQELLHVHKKLSSGGFLVIEVPHFGTLAWRIMGKRHRHFYSGHLSYFNPESMGLLLKKTGYELIEWNDVPYYMSLGWLLMRAKIPNFIVNALPKRFIVRPIRFDLNDILLVIARKK